jgi:hypothetical protein
MHEVIHRLYELGFRDSYEKDFIQSTFVVWIIFEYYNIDIKLFYPLIATIFSTRRRRFLKAASSFKLDFRTSGLRILGNLSIKLGSTIDTWCPNLRRLDDETVLSWKCDGTIIQLMWGILSVHGWFNRFYNQWERFIS